MLGAIAVGLIVGAAPAAAAPPRVPPGRTPLVEAPSCARTDVVPSEREARGDAAQVVTVTVTATAIVRVERGGRVVAATTNTGCAPRPTDTVYVEHADGTLVRATRAQFVNRRWVGDFTVPGRWVAQAR